MANATLVATIATPQDARNAACTIETSNYREDLEAFFDDRENRSLRSMMQSNRAPFLS